MQTLRGLIGGRVAKAVLSRLQKPADVMVLQLLLLLQLAAIVPKAAEMEVEP
jgi:hypothetical protein